MSLPADAQRSKNWGQSRLFKLYALAASVVTTVIASALVALLYLHRDAAARESAEIRNLANSLQLSVDGLIGMIDISLQASADEIGQQMELGRLDAEEIDQFLIRQQERIPMVATMRATNESGEAIFGKGAEVSPRAITERDLLNRLRDNPGAGLVFGKPLIGRVGNYWLWPFARRINRPDGSFAGIVYGGIHLPQFEAMFAQMGKGTSASISLRDADLRLIARHASDGKGTVERGDNSHISKPFLMAWQRNADAGTYTSGIEALNGVSRLHSYATSARYGFVVNVGVPETEVFAEWRKQAYAICALTLLFALTTIAYVWTLGKAWNRQDRDMESLLESQRALRAAQEVARLGSYVYDLKAGTWTSSDIGDDILGISKEYPRDSEHWLALVMPEDRRALNEYLNRAKEQTAPLEREFRILRARDGRESWIHGRGRWQRDPQGVPIRLVGTLQDITERKRTELALEQHREHLEERVRERTAELSIAMIKAEEANRAKSAFLANISHEVRTPMNGILGMAHLMRREGATPKQINRLDKIDAAGRHLLSIINDVLDLAKIESGRVQLERKDFSLTALLNDVTAVIGDNIKAKGLTFRIDVSGVPQQLHGDATRLRQALLNYLGNALKFTERGSITLQCRALEQSARDVVLRFDVIDTGCGIPRESLGRIFAAFEQVDNSNTRLHGGTGLGLAITKRVVLLMGGEVGVESEVGQGSAFWMTVRLGTVSLAATPTGEIADGSAEVAIRRNHQGCRVLVVEDDPINQEVTELLLRQVGLVADVASNGEEAVRKVKSAQYALILMDLQLPVMDGLAATSAIRKLDEYRTTPIVAMTANVFAEDRQACDAVGMNDFISKPLVPDNLYATILRWLD